MFFFVFLLLKLLRVLTLKSHSIQKCVLLFVTALGCLAFTVQNNVYAIFTSRLFSDSSAEGKRFLITHSRSQLKAWTYILAKIQ